MVLEVQFIWTCCVVLGYYRQVARFGLQCFQIELIRRTLPPLIGFVERAQESIMYVTHRLPRLIPFLYVFVLVPHDALRVPCVYRRLLVNLYLFKNHMRIACLVVVVCGDRWRHAWRRLYSGDLPEVVNDLLVVHLQQVLVLLLHLNLLRVLLLRFFVFFY